MLERDLAHDALPTGSLLSTLRLPALQRWSDRGGASRAIGDAWATLVWRTVRQSVGRPIDWCDRRGMLVGIVALDFDRGALPPIPRGLRVPDFLALIDQGDRVAIVPLDAKFDPSVADEEQVSGHNLHRLFAAASRLADRVTERVGDRDTVLVSGIVVAPDHWSTRALIRSRNGRAPLFPVERILMIPALPREVYGSLPLARAIGALAHIDRLPVKPAEDLAVATYYLRLVYACRWCWLEQHRPLLGSGEPEELSVDALRAVIAERSARYGQAFRLVEAWAREVEPIHGIRLALKPFLDPPLSAEEYEQVMSALAGVEGRVRRQVWRLLRERYRQRLVERVGTIMPEQAVAHAASLLARLAHEQAALAVWARAELERILRDLPTEVAEEPGPAELEPRGE